MSLFSNLEDDVSQWNIFQDGGSVSGDLSTIDNPSLDGTALSVALLGGDPYCGLHAYRNLSQSDPLASQFHLTLSFFFPESSALQALEFTMNTWVNNVRWEWAVQWEYVGDGTSQQGSPPTWRLWTGSFWQNADLPQSLASNTWHNLALDGTIQSGNVCYTAFACDDMTASLTQTFAPVSSTGEKLAVGVQLDGNYQEDPYQVFVDTVSFLLS